jgi:peptidoglycan/LPS O-acetylase OafA/YrhL
MIKSLEGGRGCAALVVALYHLGIGADYFSFIRHGYLLVDLFFVLSGFVICAAYSERMRSPAEFRSFFIRRFGRLFPLLVFSTIVFVIAANAIVLGKQIAYAHGYAALLSNPDARDFSIPGAAEIIAVLTMTHGLGIFDRLILNTPSWSISTEFFTYLLFAAACLLVGGKKRLALYAALSLAGLLICIGASVRVHDCLAQGGCLSLTYDFGFPRTVFSFFLGALTFHVSRHLAIDARILQLAGLSALCLLFWLADAYPAAGFAFPAVFAILILSICNDQGPLAAFLSREPFQVLGQRSYSIYMMHMPLLLFFDYLTDRVESALAATLVLCLFVAVLLIVSGWTYRFIEDPLRVRFNRVASRPGLFDTTTNFLKPKKSAE